MLIKNLGILGSQGGQVGYVQDFHPGDPGSAATWGKLPKK